MSFPLPQIRPSFCAQRGSEELRTGALKLPPSKTQLFGGGQWAACCGLACIWWCVFLCVCWLHVS